MHQAYVIQSGPRSLRTKLHTDLRSEAPHVELTSLGRRRQLSVLTCQSIVGFQLSTGAHARLTRHLTAISTAFGLASQCAKTRVRKSIEGAAMHRRPRRRVPRY